MLREIVIQRAWEKEDIITMLNFMHFVFGRTTEQLLIS